MVPEISLSVQFDIADEIKLPDYLVQFPVLFVRMEEIDSQTGYDPSVILVFQSVEGERIEIVSLEIHHRKQGVMNAFFQPSLCILADNGVCVPSF